MYIKAIDKLVLASNSRTGVDGGTHSCVVKMMYYRVTALLPHSLPTEYNPLLSSTYCGQATCRGFNNLLNAQKQGTL